MEGCGRYWRDLRVRGKVLVGFAMVLGEYLASRCCIRSISFGEHISDLNFGSCFWVGNLLDSFNSILLQFLFYFTYMATAQGATCYDSTCYF